MTPIPLMSGPIRRENQLFKVCQKRYLNINVVLERIQSSLAGRPHTKHSLLAVAPI